MATTTAAAAADRTANAPSILLSLPAELRAAIFAHLLPRQRFLILAMRIFIPPTSYAFNTMPNRDAMPRSMRYGDRIDAQHGAMAHWAATPPTGTTQRDSGFAALRDLRLVSRAVAADVDALIGTHMILWLHFNDLILAWLDTLRWTADAGTPYPVPRDTTARRAADGLPPPALWQDAARNGELAAKWAAHAAALGGLARWIARFRRIHVLLQQDFAPEFPQLARAVCAAAAGPLPRFRVTVAGFKDYFAVYPPPAPTMANPRAYFVSPEQHLRGEPGRGEAINRAVDAVAAPELPPDLLARPRSAPPYVPFRAPVRCDGEGGGAAALAFVGAPVQTGAAEWWVPPPRMIGSAMAHSVPRRVPPDEDLVFCRIQWETRLRGFVGAETREPVDVDCRVTGDYIHCVLKG